MNPAWSFHEPGLNTLELDQYMRNDPYIRQYYGGVKALNELNVIVPEASLFIVNHDPSHEPGSHWITLFMQQNPEHFDSLGLEPIDPIKSYLIFNGPNYLYNTKRVQSYATNSCGMFCLFYAYFRCRNYSFKEVMNMFNDNMIVNEFVVNSFYNITK